MLTALFCLNSTLSESESHTAEPSSLFDDNDNNNVDQPNWNEIKNRRFIDSSTRY